LVAALRASNSPDVDELVRVYGNSSPGRIRGLVKHLERCNPIASRKDFGRLRTISVLGPEGARAG